MKRLVVLIVRIFAGEKAKKNTTLGDVINNIMNEGLDLAKRGFLTRTEEERLVIINSKMRSVIELIALAADIENKPKLRERILANF